MRISVRTRVTKRGMEPCRICLGRSQLPVIRVLACRELPEQRCYELDVLDGRSFVIHQRESDVWELDAVYAQPQRRKPQQPAAVLQTGAALLRLCLSALGLVLRKGRKAILYAVKLRHRDNVVPA